MNAPSDWWKTFFGGLAVEFWSAVVPPAATDEDVAFLWKHLRLSPGALTRRRTKGLHPRRADLWHR